MKSLTIMIKPASGLCDLRCRYCFYTDEMKNRSLGCRGMMKLEILEQIIKKVAEETVLECTIAFQGGEPTLAGIDFFERCTELTAQYLQGVTVHYAIQTNGYHLDSAWCSFFKKHGFLVGVSLDGIRASHDAFRKGSDGSGTYETIMKHIGLLKEHGVDYNILTVVNAKTAPKIRRIYESYKKNGFAYQQYIACLDPIGVRNGQEEYSLVPEVYGTFLCELFDLWYGDLQKGRQPYIRQFESYIAILLGQVPGECEQRGVCGCQNVIEADGSVYPCDFYMLDAYKCGHVCDREYRLGRIDETSRAFIQASEKIPEVCGRCPYYHLCRNGCRRLREAGLEGDGRNLYCLAYRMFFDHSYKRLAEIAQRIYNS